MRNAILSVLFFFTSSVYALEPSDDKIAELLDLTGVKMVNDVMAKKMVTSLSDVLSRSANSVYMTPKNKAASDYHKKMLLATLSEGLSWERLKPDYIKLYRAKLSEKEIDVTLAYYRTPEGKMTAAKMPEIVENIGDLLEAKKQSLQPQFDKINKEAKKMYEDAR